MTNQLLIEAFASTNDIVGTKRWMIDLCEDFTTAILFNELIYWNSRRKGSEFIVKTYADLTEKLGLSKKQLMRCSDVLKEKGWITTEIHKSPFYNGNTAIHFKVEQKAYDDIASFLEARSAEKELQQKAPKVTSAEVTKGNFPYTVLPVVLTTDNIATPSTTQEQPQKAESPDDALLSGIKAIADFALSKIGIFFTRDTYKLLSDDYKEYGYDTLKEAIEKASQEGKGRISYKYVATIAMNAHAKKIQALKEQEAQRIKNESLVLKLPFAPTASALSDEDIDNLFNFDKE